MKDWHIDPRANRPHVDRRRFLGYGAAAALCAPFGLRRALSLDDAREPDLVVLNANVYTVDEAIPRAQAFAVHNGRFVAIGSSTEVSRSSHPDH